MTMAAMDYISHQEEYFYVQPLKIPHLMLLYMYIYDVKKANTAVESLCT